MTVQVMVKLPGVREPQPMNLADLVAQIQGFAAGKGTVIPIGANPTATAKDTAVNGSATTFMRSDAAPPVQKGSSSQFGILKVDGTSITETGGVASAASLGHGATTAVAGAATLNQGSGVVTTEALVAATTYTLTLTNSKILTTSTVLAIASDATGGVTPPTVRSITPANGSVVIVCGMTALTGTFDVLFAVFN